MNNRNRMGNVHNFYQNWTKHKRVLCVCSAGLLRSPTAALVLSQPPFNYNTRAAGVSDEYALIPVDEVLIEWAEEIVCMEEGHKMALILKFPDIDLSLIKVLNIPDCFNYRDQELMDKIKYRSLEIFGEPNA